MASFKKLKSAGITVVAIALTFPQAVFAASGWDAGIDNAKGFSLPNQTIYNIVSNFLSVLLAGFGIVGIIGFAIAGVMYVTAFGDSAKMETAKSAMQYSLIGLVVGLVGLVAVRAVDTMLKGTSVF